MKRWNLPLISFVSAVLVILTFMILMANFYSSTVKSEIEKLAKQAPRNIIVKITDYNQGLLHSQAKINITAVVKNDTLSFYGTISAKHSLRDIISSINPFQKRDYDPIARLKVELDPISSHSLKITTNPEIDKITFNVNVLTKGRIKINANTPKLNILTNAFDMEVLPMTAELNTNTKLDAFDVRAHLPKANLNSAEASGFINFLDIEVERNASGALNIAGDAELLKINGQINLSANRFNFSASTTALDENQSWSTQNTLAFNQLSINKFKYNNSKISATLSNIPNRIDLLRLFVLYKSQRLQIQNSPSIDVELPTPIALDITNFFIKKHFLNGGKVAFIKEKEIKLELANNLRNIAKDYLSGLLEASLCTGKGSNIHCQITAKEEGLEINGTLLERDNPLLERYNLGKVVQRNLPLYYEKLKSLNRQNRR